MALRVKQRGWGQEVVFEVTRAEEVDSVLPLIVDFAAESPEFGVVLLAPLDTADPEHLFEVHKGEGQNIIHYYSRPGNRV